MTRFDGTRWLAGALLAALAAPAVEAQIAAPLADAFRPGSLAASQEEPQARVGIVTDTSLTLDEAIQQALANNPDIEVARVDSEQAVYDTAGARGRFDPIVGVQTSFLHQVTPVGSLIGGSASGRLTQQSVNLGPQLSGIAPVFGTRYAVSLSTQRLTSDNQFITLNPQFPSSLSVSVTQPLFRGRRIDEPRRQIEVASQNEALTASELRQRVMDVVLQTEQAYWDLYFAEQSLQVQLEGLDLARDQVASTQRLADSGVAAPIDVVEAETQVAIVQQNVAMAQAALTRAENALKVLILPGRSSPTWSSALHATSAPRASPRTESIADAVDRALAGRPELAQTGIAASINEVQTRFLREETRPQIDLVGSYTSTGLAGRTAVGDSNPFTGGLVPLFDRINELSAAQGLSPLPSLGGTSTSVPSLLVGGYGQSLSTLFGQDFPTFQVALQVSLPLRNRTAEANLATARAEGRRIQLQRRRLEEAIEADVRNARQVVASQQARLDAAATARRLAEAQYDSEQRRFQAGTSTLFLVVQRQTVLISTRTQYAQAETDLSKAVAALERATGDTLEAHRIALQ